MVRGNTLWVLLLPVLLCAACTNPFAPALADQNPDVPILGDQRTVEGVFQNFRYSYVFRDTLTYGKLLNRAFTFVYRDYDKGVDVTWGRDEDMIATNGLFAGVQNLDLVWNDVVQAEGDSLVQTISRGFILTITYSAGDVERAQGRVNLRLERPTSTDVWKIMRWRDESNYF
ncbi:MAG: hypothetical protein J5I53_09750 [Bradyrhizobiaceae bacterium]|nr:hypothetical protein [Bradyrhizobiaceae bacterium]